MHPYTTRVICQMIEEAYEILQPMEDATLKIGQVRRQTLFCTTVLLHLFLTI